MLQIIAMISMIIDHVGLIKDIDVFRIIGRLSMPIYAYFVYKSTQKDRGYIKYIRRLLYLACISQIPYTIMIYEKIQFRFNICFTWLVCFVCVVCFNKTGEHRTKYFVFGLLLMGIFFVLPFDYGVTALLWVMIWQFIDKIDITAIIAISLPLIIIAVSTADYIQLFSFAAIPVVIYCKQHDKEYMKKEYKYIWRWFYPLHMGALLCLQ